MGKEMEADKINYCVLYTDGSCIPNPGIGGWGFHGYTYKNETPSKPLSGLDYYVTDKGYVEKSIMDSYKKGENPYKDLDEDNLKEGTVSVLDENLDGNIITPINFVDHFGPAPKNQHGLSTNNAGELKAFARALNFIVKNDINNALIYADSEYVVEGYKKYLDLWYKNNWKNRSGIDVKNKDIWKEVYELKEECKGKKIRLKWLPGHSIFLGNQLADLNANLGRILSNEGVDSIIESSIEAKSYFKQLEDDKHPLMCHQKLFFNTNSPRIPGIYFMGAIDTDIGLLGKKLSDTSYSYINLNKPVESIESLIQRHKKVMKDCENTVVAHLNTFFKPELYKSFSYFGSFVLDKFKHNDNHLSYANKHLITEIVDPPKKSLDAVLAMNNIAKWAEDWISGRDDRFTVTEITDYLFEQVSVMKKKKEVTITKLKDEIKQNTAGIDIYANYVDGENKKHQSKTTLTFGIDILDRNGLKKIESLNPKIYLLTWSESGGLYRYFTIIKTDTGYGAYCGYYSNIRLDKN